MVAVDKSNRPQWPRAPRLEDKEIIALLLVWGTGRGSVLTKKQGCLFDIQPPLFRNFPTYIGWTQGRKGWCPF